MKILALVLAFLTGLVFVVSIRGRHSGDGTPTDAKSGTSEEQEESGHLSGYQDFPYANHLDARKYIELYNKVRSMPSEDQMEPQKHLKGARTPQSFTQWESFGPLGVPGQTDPTGNKLFGRIRTLTWYFNSGTSQWERYIGAGSGGLYYGQTVFTSVIWESLGDNLPNPAVGAVAVDPTNSNVIWVGGGDWARDHGAGVWKTTDRGQHWNPTTVYPGDYVTRILFLVGNSIMIAAGNAGIYRSTDGGVSWTRKVLETGHEYAGCYRLVAANASRLYAALPGYGIYTSNDGGDTWSKQSNGLPAKSGSTISIDVSLSDANVLYASYTDTNNNSGGIWKTTNAGGLWTRTNDPPSYMHDKQGAHANVIRIHPDDPNTVYVGSVDFVKSTDGGSTWAYQQGGHSDYTAFEFDPNDANTIYVCNDGGIWLRNDAANTVANQNWEFTPGAPLQVYEMDDAWSKGNEAVAGTQDNGEIFTFGASQGGDQWVQIGGCDGGNQLSIDPSNPAVIYGNDWCGDNSPRWRTLNYGSSADNIDNGLPNGTYIPIRLAKGGSPVLFTCSPTGLYHSYTQGSTWFTSTVNNGTDFVSPYPWTPSLSVNKYATIGNKVCYLVWGGKNYRVQGTPGAMTVTDLGTTFSNLIADHGDPDEVFGITGSGIYKSTNRGAWWSNISGTYPNYIAGGATVNDVWEVVSGGAIYAATNIGVFKSNDGGQNWFTFQDGLPYVSVTKIMCVTGLNYDTLRIATYGRGFWQRLINDIPPILVSSQPLNGIVLGVSGKGGKIVGLGSLGKGILSTNAGATWDTISTGSGSNLNTVGIFDNQTFVAGGDGGMIVRTTDGGGSWNPIPAPTAANFTGLSITPSGLMWMCADDGKLLKSTDAGGSWFTQLTLSGIVLSACQFVNDNTGMLLGHTTVGGTVPVLYVTTNGGDMWTPTYPPTASDLRSLFFTGDSDGYVAGSGGTMLKTTDGGTSWLTLTTGSSRNLNGCFFTDELTGFACGDTGTFLKTEDGGGTWGNISNGLGSNLHAITMTGNGVFVGGDGAMFLMSEVHQNTVYFNLSNNWNLVSLPLTLPDTSVADLFPARTSSAFMYDGSGYGLASTLSPGTGYWLRFSGDQVTHLTGTPLGTLSIPVHPGWNLIGSIGLYLQTENVAGIPAGIVTSQFFGYNGGYMVSKTIEPGKAYWVNVTQAGTLVFSSSPAALPASAGRIRIAATGELPPPPPGQKPATAVAVPTAFLLEQNYPNPFNPTTVVRYSLPLDAHVSLKIYDLLGRQVAELAKGTEKAGYQSVTWNASGAASGVYFIRLEAEALDHSLRYNASRKMVVLK